MVGGEINMSRDFIHDQKKTNMLYEDLPLPDPLPMVIKYPTNTKLNDLKNVFPDGLIKSKAGEIAPDDTNAKLQTLLLSFNAKRSIPNYKFTEEEINELSAFIPEKQLKQVRSELQGAAVKQEPVAKKEEDAGPDRDVDEDDVKDQPVSMASTRSADTVEPDYDADAIRQFIMGPKKNTQPPTLEPPASPSLDQMDEKQINSLYEEVAEIPDWFQGSFQKMANLNAGTLPKNNVLIKILHARFDGVPTDMAFTKEDRNNLLLYSAYTVLTPDLSKPIRADDLFRLYDATLSDAPTDINRNEALTRAFTAEAAIHDASKSTSKKKPKIQVTKVKKKKN